MADLHLLYFQRTWTPLGPPPDGLNGNGQELPIQEPEFQCWIRSLAKLLDYSQLSIEAHGKLTKSRIRSVSKKGISRKKSNSRKKGTGSPKDSMGVECTEVTTSVDQVKQAESFFQKACVSHQKGDIGKAIETYKSTVHANPSHASAWRNLGALLRQQGQLVHARQCTERALQLDSKDGSLWGNYGNVLRDLGLLEESADAFRSGLQRNQESHGLLHGLAISLGHKGEHQQVIELLTPVVEASSNPINGSNSLAELLLELGNAHHALGQKGLALKYWNEGTHGAEGEKRLFIGLNIAQVLCGQKQFDEASQICKSLEPLFPSSANLMYAEGVIAKGQGQYDKAINLFEQSLKRDPAYPICLNTYGLLLRDIGRSHRARGCFEEALKHDPSFGPAMNNLGSVLKDVARYEEALIWLRKGSAALDNPAAHSNVLFTLVGYELEPSYKCFAEASHFAKRFGRSAFPRWRDGIPDPAPERVLKVGLISPDFCRHAVSYFVEPLLEHWDRNEIVITLYSCGEQQDDYSARLKKKADQWRDFRGQSDEACIAQIQRDEIDILIDLAGHTAGNRLPVLAAKPAPIQATYLGYYGTTGLEEVDYWITDNVLHPCEADGNDPCSETRWRLKRCYVSYRPLKTAPPVSPPPCLKQDKITFGSFNQTRKITKQTAQNWLAVLKAVPNSCLMLKSKNLGEEVEQARVIQLFSELGLAPERLELRGHCTSLEDHLATYHDVDVALDTYPYTGCTTTADALWMGVPVLTVAGKSMVSRQAAAVLAGVGCADFICADAEAMASRAFELCKDRKSLLQRRLQQRQQVANSALLDHKGLANELSTSFRDWWHRWLNEQGWNNSDCQQKQPAWPLTCSSASAISLDVSHLSQQLPMWLGAMNAIESQSWQDQGIEVVPLQTLNPWGSTVKLFRPYNKQRVLVWMEQGLPKKDLSWWQRVYPQLQWDLQGPLNS